MPASSSSYAVSKPPDLVSAAGHVIGGSNKPPVLMDNPMVDLAPRMAARIATIAERRAEMDAPINAGRSAGKVVLKVENALDVEFPVEGDLENADADGPTFPEIWPVDQEPHSR